MSPPKKNTDTAFDNIKNQVLDSIDSFIFTKDLSGKYTYANQAVLDLFDKKLHEVVGQSDDVFFDLKLSVQLQKNDQKVMTLGIRVESEETNYIKVLNETRTYRSVKKPLFDEQGNIRNAALQDRVAAMVGQVLAHVQPAK